MARKRQKLTTAERLRRREQAFKNFRLIPYADRDSQKGTIRNGVFVPPPSGLQVTNAPPSKISAGGTNGLRPFGSNVGDVYGDMYDEFGHILARKLGLEK